MRVRRVGEREKGVPRDIIDLQVVGLGSGAGNNRHGLDLATDQIGQGFGVKYSRGTDRIVGGSGIIDLIFGRPLFVG